MQCNGKIPQFTAVHTYVTVAEIDGWMDATESGRMFRASHYIVRGYAFVGKNVTSLKNISLQPCPIPMVPLRYFAVPRRAFRRLLILLYCKTKKKLPEVHEN